MKGIVFYLTSWMLLFPIYFCLVVVLLLFINCCKSSLLFISAVYYWYQYSHLKVMLVHVNRANRKLAGLSTMFLTVFIVLIQKFSWSSQGIFIKNCKRFLVILWAPFSLHLQPHERIQKKHARIRTHFVNNTQIWTAWKYWRRAKVAL